MKTGLRGCELDRGLILGDCVHMPLSLSVCLRQDAMHEPRIRVRFEHLGIAVFRDQQMRSPAMIQNVLIVGAQLRGFIESIRRVFGTVLRQTHYSEPHPRGGIFGICGCFLLHSRSSVVKVIQAELRDAEKQTCAMKMRLQFQRFAQADNGFVVFAQLFINQAKIEMRLGETRLTPDSGCKAIGCFPKFPLAHVLGGLDEFRRNDRDLRRDTNRSCEKQPA